MRGLDSVPPSSGGVAHAMAVGAEVDGSAGAVDGGARCSFRSRCRPDLSEVVRAIHDVLLPAILARLRTKKLAEMLTPAITRLSLDLCSAPSRRVAPLRPRDPERLRP